MMISVALLLAGSSVAAGQGKAYSLDDLVGLLKRKVASTRVLTLAKQNCISFVMTPDVETVLKRAGGTSDLISGLETVCNPNNPKVAADTAHRVMPGAVPVPVASAPVDTFVPVVIRAAVVNPDLTVRPLPQLDLLLITPRGDSLHVSTDLEGKFTRSLRPGGYRIESMAEVAGMRYRWAFNCRDRERHGADRTHAEERERRSGESGRRRGRHRDRDARHRADRRAAAAQSAHREGDLRA